MKRVTTLLLFAAFLFSAFLPLSALAEDPGETLRVGWFPYAGSAEVHDGQYSGYSYDYLMEIAKYTDWQYEFVEADFATCNEMLKNGEVDLVCGLQRSPEREAIFDFPETPFGETYSVLYTNEKSPLQPYDYDSFNGIKVGMLKSTLNDQYFADFAQENGFSYEMEKFTTAEEMNAAIGAGEIDAAIITAGVVEARILAKFAPNSLYIVTTKGNQEVLVDLDWALSIIKRDNQYFSAELYQKHYFDKEVLDFTKEEQAAVQASQEKPVLVGVVENGAPVSFWNETTGAYEGIAVDMLNVVLKKAGLTACYVPVNASHLNEAATPGEEAPQFVLGVTKAEVLPDTRDWHLSESVLADSLAVVGWRAENLSAEKEQKTVAVVTGFDMASEYAKHYMPDFTPVEYETLQDCVSAVASRKVDCAIHMDSTLRYILQKPTFENLEIIPTFSEKIDICAAGFTEESATYISIISKGMRKVTESESRNIVLNYTVGNPYKLTLQDTLYKYRAPLFVIAGLVVFVVALFSALYLTKRKSNNRVKEALAEATQASAAKGRFMSRMSHEIRTPLNAVIGYNTIARNELTEAKTDAEQRAAEMKVMDCLTKSDIASRHLLTIINDVLDISAIESGKIKVVNERFDFKGLISSLTAIFYSQAKAKGVDFDVRFETQMDEWVVGDQMRMNQILTNLLSNAVKFTPDGGKVTLLISPKTEENKTHVHFEVQDTGIGMTAEQLKQIWTPFEQADVSISRRFGGTGLGLSITKTLVELLNGKISVQSEEGKGSCFTVDLVMERTEQPAGHGVYDFSAVNALIVDDDASTCDYIRLLLTRSGVSSTAVNSGEEAIHAVQKAMDANEPYTVCLVDWRMPKMDGLETVRHIRSIAGDDLPIIVITAYDFSEVAAKAAEVGVNRFISKPLFQSSLFNLFATISGTPTPQNTEKFTSYDFSGSRVLLAEDNTMNMEIACEILKSAKFQVDHVWNGQEAVDAFLAAPSGRYDAILMDVQMPVMDGYEATKAIRASGHSDAATIPIIAMTADAFSENIAESRSAGMNAHIPKPIDLPTLFETLRQYIH